MKPIVTHTIISSLKGESGSNPEIHTIFPNDSGIKIKRIESQILPSGARTGEIHEFSHRGQDLLVFVSELKVEGRRPDIVTISALLNEFVDKTTIIEICKTIFIEIQVDNFAGMDDFTKLAKKLYTGLNSGNFNLDSYTFDLQGYLTEKGLSLEKEVIKVKGGLF